ncbi:hypothetical protein VDGL01_10139 [Verticillium dahliae]
MMCPQRPPPAEEAKPPAHQRQNPTHRTHWAWQDIVSRVSCPPWQGSSSYGPTGASNVEDTLQFLESLANKVASVHGSPAFRRRPSMSCISRIPDLNPYLARDFPHAAIALPAAVARDMGIRRGDHLITIKHCNMSRTPPRRRSNVRVGSSISCSSIERPPSLPRPDHLAGHSLHSFHEGPQDAWHQRQ